MKKTIYIILCILGTIIPYAFFVPFLAENGLDLGLFAQEMFATQVASFFSADVLVSSLALWAFIFFELRKRHIKNWWLAIIGNLAVGVSLALPLFLLLRELTLEE
jgi:hypothetical protein